MLVVYIIKFLTRCADWKKIKFQIKGNQFSIHWKKKSKEILDIQSLVINISNNNLCKFDLDTGNNVYHMRTKTIKERDAILSELRLAKETGNSSPETLKELYDSLDLKIQGYSKTLKIVNSLETVLSSRLDILSLEGTVGNGMNKSEHSDDSSEKRKSKKMSRKSVNESTPKSIHSESTFWMNAKEFHTTSKQLVSTSELLFKHLLEIKERLDTTVLKLEKQQSIDRTESYVQDDLETQQPFIYLNNDDNSDSDDYFDPLESGDEDNDSSSDTKVDKNKQLAKPEKKDSIKFISPPSINKNQIDYINIGKSYGISLSTVPDEFEPRTRLPGSKDMNNKASLWKLLKESVGKDLSKVTVPIQFSEPTSMLQKLAEDFEYAELLHKAAEEPNSILRIMYVLAFAASGYASTLGRISKPFNPILGETYEWCNKEKNFRFVSEQVSHHPPISACYIDSPSWVLWEHFHIKNKFWGKSIEIIPSGPITLITHKYGDHFSWGKLTSSINNLFVGQKSVDHFGQLTIINHTTNEKIDVEFKKKGWISSNAHEVKGYAYDANGEAVYKIEGKWSEELIAHSLLEKKDPLVLWTRRIDPDINEKEFNLPRFAKQLNELPDYMKEELPPTDSRLRPDQKALEEGNTDFASQEKSRLEEKQREVKRLRDEKGIEYKPRWFKFVDNAWIYNGEYWEYRNSGKWPEDLPDIF